jgi:DNA-binding NtrC family response regulator
MILMHIADVLGEASLHVVEAGNADEALEVLECRGDITSVVTDVRMPGTIDGLDLAPIIAEQWKYVGLVVLSGHASAADPRLPAAASFIQKPLAMHALLSRLLH